jgi:hypothetical protein
MLQRKHAITNEVLEIITLILACPTVLLLRITLLRNRSSLLRNVIGLRPNNRKTVTRFQQQKKFCFSNQPKPGTGTIQPTIRSASVALSLVVKRPVCEEYHSSPFHVAFKHSWSHNSTPHENRRYEGPNSHYLFIYSLFIY